MLISHSYFTPQLSCNIADDAVKCHPPQTNQQLHLGGLPVISRSLAWQLQALTKIRYQAEHQQLAEMKSRSVLQRLRVVFVADWPVVITPHQQHIGTHIRCLQ